MSSFTSPDFQLTVENSTKALNEMKIHQVLPIPENYHLWYTYTGDYDLSLTKVIDKLIFDNIPIDESVSKKLYQKFFSKDDEKKAINQAGEGFKIEITKLIDVLKDASKNTSGHTTSLANHLDKLSDFDGANELSDIIKLVLKDVEKLNSQSHKLEEQLEKSSDKIKGLESNLENARIESRTDALTNIGNRKYFDEKLSELIGVINTEQNGFSLIISDIDHFKKFNDTFGHQIGDQVLKIVAHVLKNATSSIGLPYRYGGEEFVILVPNSKLEEATTLAQTIRQVISTKSIKNKNTGQDFGKITMSFGIAQFRNSDSPASIIHRADEAMYLAKDNGRNRVQLETDLSKDESSNMAMQV